jgi:FkbM family methyltransferase
MSEILKMIKNTTNEQRTQEYLKKFDRNKVLSFLIRDQSPVIFDVGANSGSSLVEFKKNWPGALIHCFEPQEECWTDLKIAAEAYEVNSIFINKVGAGSKDCEEMAFYTHEITSGQSGFNRVNINSNDSIKLKEIDNQQARVEYVQTLNHERVVPIIRLDGYISAKKINKVNLLKIDTQGYEPEVLEGLGNSLAHVEVVLTELMFYDFYERSLSFSDIEKFLLPAGFKLYDISHISKNPMNGRTDWIDVIYVNESLRAR